MLQTQTAATLATVASLGGDADAREYTSMGIMRSSRKRAGVAPADKECPNAWRRLAVREALDAHASPDGLVRMSKSHLAASAGLSVRATDGIVRELIARGELDVLDIGGARTANLYRVAPLALDELGELRARKRSPAWHRHLSPMLAGHAVSACVLRHVYAMHLARRYGDTSEAWPSLDALARAGRGISRRSIVTAREILVRVGLLRRRELVAGDRYPSGYPGHAGALVFTCVVIPRPRRASTAPAAPPGTANERGEVPQASAASTAPAALKALSLEATESEETPRACARPADVARQVVTDYAASAYPGESPDSFVSTRVIRCVVALLATGWTADELVRVASKGVASSTWLSDPHEPARRTPSLIFADAERLAAWRVKWRQRVRVDVLERAEIAASPRVAATEQEIAKSRADVARLFGQRRATA